VILVGAVQLQLLPHRRAAGDLHLHLHQDAIPCHAQQAHRVYFYAFQIAKPLWSTQMAFPSFVVKGM
jgi:hypothetical protein